ncbi:MAG TPA: hypothetical protein VGF96_06370 [Terracidiphilus sp.]|jgi:hypothetical protein
MESMTSRDLHKAIKQGLKEVSRRLVSGELDGSGRFFTDEELAAAAATGEFRKKIKSEAAPAA